MAQVKKVEVEHAITQAAYELFKTQGYLGTRMPQIAKAAHISAANIYVYFDSKLDILISVYQRWFEKKLEMIQHQSSLCTSPKQALKQLLIAMWQTLPAADDGFCGTLIEALSDRTNHSKYSTQLRASIENTLEGLLSYSLPKANAQQLTAIATMLIMAFDGYALNYHLRNGQTAHDSDIDLWCEILSSTYIQQSIKPA